jgi:hypothetical protein
MHDPSTVSTRVRAAFISLRNRLLSRKTRPFVNCAAAARCYAARVLEGVWARAWVGLAAGLLAVACSSRGDGPGFASGPDDDAGAPPVGADASNDAPSSAPASVDGSTWKLTGDGEAPPAGSCPYRDSTDHDGDGFSFAQGDCNDCDPNTNPGAFDVPKDGIDEDCDGKVDDEPTGCDAAVVLDSSNALDAARAMDLCRTTTADATGKARTWGVVSATFVAPDGTDQCTPAASGVVFGGLGGSGTAPGTTGSSSCVADADFGLGHGNLSKLGVVKPREGAHMLGLSSGTARDPTDPGYSDVAGFDKQFTVNAAAGFPAPAPACPSVITGQPHDGAALSLTIRVPTNAQSFSLSEDFFSYEFPGYICSTYNDTFVVEMTPPPPAASSTSVGGNIAFDQAGNPVCVNNSLLQVCDAQTAGGKTFACPLGPSQLQGTGFGADTTGGTDHAATGWLTTTVNVDASLRGKDITLLFAIWDSGDGILDSTALIDGFTWSTTAGKATPVTQPSPVQ